jgi:dihydrofolate reductase
MKRIIISAMAKNRVIGTKNGLPWSIPEEYQHFLKSIQGNVMLMGRKSWDIFHKDLADTEANIIISRSSLIRDAITAESLDEALNKAESFQRDIYIAGGASIYQQALEAGLVDEMHLSFLSQTHKGDAFFPEFDKSEWSIKDEQHYPQYHFIKYTKNNSEPNT